MPKQKFFLKIKLFLRKIFENLINSTCDPIIEEESVDTIILDGKEDLLI